MYNRHNWAKWFPQIIYFDPKVNLARPLTNGVCLKACDVFQSTRPSSFRSYPTNSLTIFHSFLLQVKVMLKISKADDSLTSAASSASPPFLSVDSRKRQITLLEPGGIGIQNGAPEERRVGVAAPKMFAFDAIFSDEPQVSWSTPLWALRKKLGCRQPNLVTGSSILILNSILESSTL
jgi:hypothetical protein